MATSFNLEKGRAEKENFRSPPSNPFSLATFWPVGSGKYKKLSIHFFQFIF